MHCARVASELGERCSRCVSCHRCRHEHTFGVAVATLGLCLSGHGFGGMGMGFAGRGE
jgi:hypothetical protein